MKLSMKHKWKYWQCIRMFLNRFGNLIYFFRMKRMLRLIKLWLKMLLSGTNGWHDVSGRYWTHQIITLSPTSSYKFSLTRIPLANLNALRVREDGQIYTSIRLTVVAACRMYLNHFPMDVQVCNLKEPGLNWINEIQYTVLY